MLRDGLIALALMALLVAALWSLGVLSFDGRAASLMKKCLEKHSHNTCHRSL